MRAKVTSVFINQTTKLIKRLTPYQGNIIFENEHFMTIAKEDSKGNVIRNETVNKCDIYPCNSAWQNDYLVEVMFSD